MAGRYSNSFQRSNTATVPLDFTSLTGSPGNPIIAGVGRFGGAALRLGTAGDNNECVATVVLDSQPTWIVQWARQPNAIVANELLCSLYDGATSQVDIRTGPLGTDLIATRNGTQLGATVTGVFTSGAYTHLVMTATIHPTTGTLAVYVNGIVTAINLTGQNTRTSANSTADSILLRGRASGAYISDFVVMDGTGTINNAWTGGELRVDSVFPNADSTPLLWTPSAAGTHFSKVNEAAHDGNATYVEDGTIGDEDMYDFTDSTAAGAIAFTMHNIVAEKTDAGVRQIAAECKSGAAAVSVGATQTLGTTYAAYRRVVELDPNTAAQFLLAGFNAAKWGAKVIA